MPPGCKLLHFEPHADIRGSFIKLFHDNDFASHGIDLTIREQFLSISNRNVVRGLHFQLPPYDHNKLVSCVQGKIFDAVIDLRVGSPTFFNTYSTTLQGGTGISLYIPTGFAHGFCALTDNSIVSYSTSTHYSAQHDRGILWSSADINWPLTDSVIISERDKLHPSLCNFTSPFFYNPDLD